jgi:type IV secretion system protein VirB11
MNFIPTDLLAHDTMVRELLRPLLRYLALPGATEIVVNRPQDVYIEVGAAWQHHRAPDLTLDRLTALATAIATATEQEIGPHHPILSAMLPDGERVQIVLPPAVELGTVSISIRRPSAWIKTLEEYETEGAFNRYVWAKPSTLGCRVAELDPVERQLVDHLATRQLGSFIRAAVLAKKNVAVVGDTGSGKTTLMKSICQAVPAQERLITIEDVCVNCCSPSTATGCISCTPKEDKEQHRCRRLS